MTILCAFLRGPEQAILATDSETWTDGRVAGHKPKLAVNALLGAAGCGSGTLSVVGAASSVLTAAENFDDAIAAIPHAMRSATVKHGAWLDKEPEVFWADYIAAGWSNSAGRVIAWHFSFNRFYAAVLLSRHVFPAVDVAHDTWCPDRIDDLVQLARRQMPELQAKDEAAGSKGALVIADVRRNRVSLNTIENFLTNSAPTCERLTV